jgi:hypothetical protein
MLFTRTIPEGGSDDCRRYACQSMRFAGFGVQSSRKIRASSRRITSERLWDGSERYRYPVLLTESTDKTLLISRGDLPGSGRRTDEQPFIQRQLQGEQ